MLIKHRTDHAIRRDLLAPKVIGLGKEEALKRVVCDVGEKRIVTRIVRRLCLCKEVILRYTQSVLGGSSHPRDSEPLGDREPLGRGVGTCYELPHDIIDVRAGNEVVISALHACARVLVLDRLLEVSGAGDDTTVHEDLGDVCGACPRGDGDRNDLTGVGDGRWSIHMRKQPRDTCDDTGDDHHGHNRDDENDAPVHVSSRTPKTALTPAHDPSRKPGNPRLVWLTGTCRGLPAPSPRTGPYRPQ